MKTEAYLYRWIEISSGKWYIGSRTKRGCRPGDGYICSSKTVKPMIVANPSNWRREIVVIGDPLYIRELETKFLIKLNAANDPNSFNLSNSHGTYTFTGQKHTTATRLAISNRTTGVKKTGVHRDVKGILNPCYGRIGDKNPMYGKKHDSAMRQKLSNMKMAGNNPRAICVLTPHGKFDTIKAATAFYKIGHQTLRKWIKDAKPGFAFSKSDK